MICIFLSDATLLERHYIMIIVVLSYTPQFSIYYTNILVPILTIMFCMITSILFTTTSFRRCYTNILILISRTAML